jgi:hypothetical protein
MAKIIVTNYISTYQEGRGVDARYFATFATPTELYVNVSEGQLYQTFGMLAKEVRTEAAMGKATFGRIPERTQKQHDMRMVYDALRGIESERFKTLRENGVSEAAMLQQSKEISDGLVARISKTSYAIPQRNYLGLMT